MFELPKLEYGYGDLEPVIDRQTMEIHHSKHHQTYVDNLNKSLEGVSGVEGMDVLVVLRNLPKVPEAVRTKVRNNGGGHFNHSLFWKFIKPNGVAMSSSLQLGIEQKYGSVDQFKSKWEEAALARFGSGWVWLLPDLSIVTTANQDNPVMDGGPVPMLGLDVWEHAYYLKYQNRRAEYVKSWWAVVDWAEAEKRRLESLV
jgi:Fe-Mn family superoxide dismutase